MVTRQWSEVTRLSADCQTTIFRRFKQFEIFWKKSLNGHPTVVGGHATVGRLSNNVFWTSQAIWENFENSRWTVTREWLEVTRIGRLSNNVFSTFQANRKFFDKSRWTVTWQWSEVGRLSADCQTTIFRRFKQFGRILKKVAERSRDSGLRSRDRRLTVKQPFLDVSSNLGKFWKKSLNGHATVVGGHATVGRLSNNVFWTFQAIRKFFEKSRWTVTRQWSEVTRLSADCQTTIFRRFKQFGRILKKSRWTVTRQWSEVTRPSADCQTTFFGRFKQLEIFLKKVAERSRDSGRRSRGCRLTVKQRFFDVSSNLKFFGKSRWTVTRQWSEVTRPSADCRTTFFGRLKRFGKILKIVAERSRESSWRSRDHRPTVKQRFFDFSSK